VLVAAALAAGPALLAAAGAAALALLVARWALGAPAGAISRPVDCEYTLELLRRAYGGRAAWAIGLRVGDAVARAPDDAGLDDAVLERGIGLVRLASVDGRAHVAPEAAGTFVAVGDFPYGAGILLAQPDARACGDRRRDHRSAAAGRGDAHRRARGLDADGQLVARRLALQASGPRRSRAWRGRARSWPRTCRSGRRGWW
jgi:hypothetical protein